MKSEHRHELAENDLSKLLARWGAEFDKHANTILTVLIVAALIVAGIIYWTRTSAATSQMGWTDLVNASTAEDYQSVAEMYAGTPVAQWATLRAADGFLREGIRLSLTDRPASDERLSQARESYEALLNNTSVPVEIREQVLLGLAVTLESTSDGDTADAIKAYEQLIAEFPNTRFKKYADDRIAKLKTGAAQDFYAWYSGIDPRPADLPGPQDNLDIMDPTGGTSLLRELGGGGIPDSTPFEIPDDGTSEADGNETNPFAGGEMKDEGTAKSDAAAAESDAAANSDTPAPEEKPAAQQPGESTESKDSGDENAESETENPAEQEKPAETEPADGAAKDEAETPAEQSDAPTDDEDDSKQ